MPSTYACAVVEMKVIALACVAMIERPIAYQGIVFPASRNCWVESDPRPRHRP